MDHKCPYCSVRKGTPSGLHLHILQAKRCRAKMEAACQMEADTAEQASGHGLADEVPSPTAEEEDHTMSDLNFVDMDVDLPATDFRPSTTQASNSAPAEGVQPHGTPMEHPRKNDEERFVQDFTPAAGVTKGAAPTRFENERADQDRTDQPPWAPFETKKEWELARWLMICGVSQAKINEFLKLEIIREDLNPSSAGHFKTEEVELWHRNPLECIVELFSNPKFKGKQAYAPIRVFKNADGTNREYSEMWTSNWWWEIQELLEDGATVCPVILSSDKTHLTRFSGDKMAWPVYLSIGNIQKATRPAGCTGVDMVCADGFIRRIFPILAAYIADYPEQCLVCCCKENTCPECAVEGHKRGEYLVHAMLRDVQATLAVLDAKAAGLAPPEFVDQNLRLVNPFWRDLPHCDIFSCMTPDLLHQLHKGVFHDHIVSWASEAMKGQQEEVDERFQAMSLHPTLRHFKKGISLTSQWTGTEHKNMEKVFLGVLAGATDPQVILAVRGILDFIYYAHFETHSDESLAKLDAAWFAFHQNKEVFERLEIREHFNISKVHNIKHYPDSIRSRGTADGFNTEGTERLHIDLAKMGYQAGNKKDYVSQMTVWLGRQEAVHQRALYLQWAVPGYTAALVHDDEATGEPDDEGNGGGILEEMGVDNEEVVREVEQTKVVYHVAKKPAITGLSANAIAADFDAPDFLVHFEAFLAKYLPSTIIPVSTDTTFALYKRLVLFLPGRDRVITAKGIKRAVAARRSTVLIRVKPPGEGEAPLDEFCAADVKVIFRLPEEFGNFSCPLAYVSWYTAFQTLPVDGLAMYKISRSTRAHRRRVSIIPVTDIVRSCHLIPGFGGWTADTVLTEAPYFYLNPYLRHHDFVWLPPILLFDDILYCGEPGLRFGELLPGADEIPLELGVGARERVMDLLDLLQRVRHMRHLPEKGFVRGPGVIAGPLAGGDLALEVLVGGLEILVLILGRGQIHHRHRHLPSEGLSLGRGRRNRGLEHGLVVEGGHRRKPAGSGDINRHRDRTRGSWG
ncbi:hypothetical protein BJ912DRAFT_1025406 [Pholiota molesta]|nr:hypothetical protein BJ912DRAFT_1025406 [Pholiota molesta]